MANGSFGLGVGQLIFGSGHVRVNKIWFGFNFGSGHFLFGLISGRLIFGLISFSCKRKITLVENVRVGLGLFGFGLGHLPFG